MQDTIKAQSKINDLTIILTSIQSDAIQQCHAIIPNTIVAQSQIQELFKEVNNLQVNAQKALMTLQQQQQLSTPDISAADQQISNDSGNAVAASSNNRNGRAKEPFKFIPIPSPEGSIIEIPRKSLTGTSARLGGRDPARIYIGRLPFDITENDLRNLFSKFGDIEDLSLSGGHLRKFGYLNFKDPSSSTRAIEEMDGYLLGHERISVDLAKPKGSCYNCKREGHRSTECPSK